MRLGASAAACVLLLAPLSCTNSYEDFRFPKRAAASSRADAAALEETDAGALTDAASDATPEPETP